ncbi:hypothetical protein HZA42_04590 [Candidatus Peregrinibacteria bacterium]|nr:hypothetical protein [Candidatus Peregrinibacteria bacterium]
MSQDQCISVTELRTNTQDCLENLEKEPKYIFINNRPIAVLLDINVYEANFMKPELVELETDEVDENLLKQAKQAKKIKKSDLINIH